MTSRDMQADQATFRKTAEQGVDLHLSMKLIMEEVGQELIPHLQKFMESPTLENKVAVFDDVIDSLYVLMDLANAMNLPIAEGWQEVHRANMAKFSKGLIKNSAGKVMKPEGWQPPNLWDVLYKHESGQLELFK